MNAITGVLLVFAIIIISTVGTALIKHQVFKSLYCGIKEEKFDKVLKKNDSFFARAFLPEYARENIRLSVYMKQENKELVKEQFNRIAKMNLGDSQKIDLYTKGYQFFYEHRDMDKCEKLNQELKNRMGEAEWAGYKCFLEKNIKNKKVRQTYA